MIVIFQCGWATQSIKILKLQGGTDERSNYD